MPASAPYLTLRIVRIIQETDQARSYVFEPEGGQVDWLPGQFLTFIIPAGHEDLRRSYSILSLPGEPLKIIVKKVENGAISRLILQRWKVGDVVHSLHPAGRFTLSPQQEKSRDIFFFAAGSGIVPLFPQIRYLLEREKQSILHLIYINHTESGALFLRELGELERQFATFDLYLLYSDPAGTGSRRGRLSNIGTEALLREKLRYQKEDAIFMLCGPFAFMRMLSFTIGAMHFPKVNIRKENYLPEIMRAGQAHHRLFPARQVTIFAPEKHEVQVAEGKDILTAALEQGLQLPYSCRGGVCGNCAAKCVSGSVYMSINEVLTDADLQAGWVLTCTGHPETENVVLELPA
jgi:ring-1,2-phenylacetyl-CoA epoxidase subunit PaaE